MKPTFKQVECQPVDHWKLNLDAVQSNAVLMIFKYAFDTLILSSNSTESNNWLKEHYCSN